MVIFRSYISKSIERHPFGFSGMTGVSQNRILNLARIEDNFPQQCELMGSSAQNSSGVHWCRRRVRFNEVPEKVPKVPEKVRGFGAEPSQAMFNRIPKKVPEKVWEALVQSLARSTGFRPGQVQ